VIDSSAAECSLNDRSATEVTILPEDLRVLGELVPVGADDDPALRRQGGLPWSVDEERPQVAVVGPAVDLHDHLLGREGEVRDGPAVAGDVDPEVGDPARDRGHPQRGVREPLGLRDRTAGGQGEQTRGDGRPVASGAAELEVPQGAERDPALLQRPVHQACALVGAQTRGAVEHGRGQGGHPEPVPNGDLPVGHRATYQHRVGPGPLVALVPDRHLDPRGGLIP